MWDRFTKTYLDKWATESLRQEWKYIHGQKKAPCSSKEMQIRVLSEGKLANIMADRLARSDQRSPTLADSFVMQAVKFLNEDRRNDAVILFRAAVLKEPDSADAHNNLGFCLLPDDPNEALRYFEKALQLNGHGRLVDINRILTLVLLGRHTLAIDFAQAFLDSETVDGLYHAWLWDYDSILNKGQPVLIEVQDFKEYVCGLVKTIKL